MCIRDSFFALDGLLDTFITVLNQMEAFPAVIESEKQRYLPFLLTTTLLMESIKRGAGREDAHEAIKKHALSAVEDLRKGRISENDLVLRLSRDKKVGLDMRTIQSIIKKGERALGSSNEQVEYFLRRARSWGERYPEAKNYSPPAIL